MSTQRKYPKIVIRRSQAAPGDSEFRGEFASRLVSVEIVFDLGIDSTVTTNEAQLWEGTIRPALIDHALQAFGGGSTAADVTLAPELDWVENRVSGRLFLLVATGSRLLEQRYSAQMARDYGRVLVPIVSDNPFAMAAFSGSGVWSLTEILHRRSVGTGYGPDFEGGGGNVSSGQAMGSFRAGSLGGGSGQAMGSFQAGSLTASMGGSGGSGSGSQPTKRLTQRDNYTVSTERLGVSQYLTITSESWTRTRRYFDPIEASGGTKKTTAIAQSNGPAATGGSSSVGAFSGQTVDLGDFGL